MRRLALVLPLLLALPACGSDDDGRAAYVEQAEAVCASANEELAALGEPTSIAELPDYTAAVVDLLERTVQEVSALEPPEEDREELTAKVLDPFTDDLVTAEAYAADVRTAAESGDSPGLLALVQNVPNTTADLAFMREYGLTECASAADTSD